MGATMAHISRRQNKSGGVSWFVTYRDARGRQIKTKGGATKAIALEVARKLEDEVAREKHGLVDRHAEELKAHATRPIAEHIEVFEQHLRSRNNSPAHIADTLSKVRAVALACGWDTLAGYHPRVARPAPGESDSPWAVGLHDQPHMPGVQDVDAANASPP